MNTEGNYIVIISVLVEYHASEFKAISEPINVQ